MKLLHLIQTESKVSLPGLATMAALSGLSSALVLAIINTAAEQAENDIQSFRYLLMFGIVLMLFVFSQRYILQNSTAEIERILHRIRVRLADKVRRSDLLPLERVGRSVIYASINKETLTISQAAGILVVGCQSAILVLFAALYIAWLSKMAFFITLAFISIALSVHFGRQKKINDDLHEAMERENRLFDGLTDLLNGFKEVKVNEARGTELFDDIEAISESVVEVKTRVQANFALHITFSQMTFFVLLAAMVFLVPRFSTTYPEVVVKVTSAILFMIGPITALVASIPILANANAACENIYRLEDALSQSIRRMQRPHGDSAASVATFESIEFDGVMFEYAEQGVGRSFSVGPINLVIPAGEMVFIAGGNGSGKSTFLKLLTALYYAQKGVLRFNGASLSEANVERYRNLFSVIFSDYHLFRRLYGLKHIDDNQIAALLRDMELDHKTSLVDGEFETLDLSSGQKKRLALLVALLEDKPIYVFDEWAADQDPVFRKRFYEELLPQLKQQGKTIIAATHDDRYFHVADRILKMEEGRLIDSGN